MQVVVILSYGPRSFGNWWCLKSPLFYDKFHTLPSVGMKDPYDFGQIGKRLNESLKGLKYSRKSLSVTGGRGEDFQWHRIN